MDGPAISDMSLAVANRDLLDLILRRLPPDQRAVVVLHYYFDLTIPDVAQTLGIPVGTAKSRHHRALALMREAMAEIDPLPAPVAGGQYA